MAKPQWQAKVRGMLRDGYGVEDISVILEAPLSDVRNMVQVMRRSGVLAVMFNTTIQLEHK